MLRRQRSFFNHCFCVIHTTINIVNKVNGILMLTEKEFWPHGPPETVLGPQDHPWRTATVSDHLANETFQKLWIQNDDWKGQGQEETEFCVPSWSDPCQCHYSLGGWPCLGTLTEASWACPGAAVLTRPWAGGHRKSARPSCAARYRHAHNHFFVSLFSPLGNLTCTRFRMPISDDLISAHNS